MERSPRQRQNRRRATGATEPATRPGGGRRDGTGQRPRRPPVRARGLDRAVEIFQLLHAVRKPIPIGEIARRLKAPRSTIYEIVNLFLAADILEYSGDGSEVFFGRAIYLYANDYFATHAMVRLGQEEVRRLAPQTGETCQFCMPVGNKYTVVSMQNSARLFRIGSDVGVLVPIPWTASGRFFVAHMSLAELKAFIPPEDFRLQDGGASTRGNSSPRPRRRAMPASAPSPAWSTTTPPAWPRPSSITPAVASPASASSSRARPGRSGWRNCRRCCANRRKRLSAVPEALDGGLTRRPESPGTRPGRTAQEPYQQRAVCLIILASVVRSPSPTLNAGGPMLTLSPTALFGASRKAQPLRRWSRNWAAASSTAISGRAIPSPTRPISAASSEPAAR